MQLCVRSIRGKKIKHGNGVLPREVRIPRLKLAQGIVILKAQIPVRRPRGSLTLGCRNRSHVAPSVLPSEAPQGEIDHATCLHALSKISRTSRARGRITGWPTRRNSAIVRLNGTTRSITDAVECPQAMRNSIRAAATAAA